MATSNSDRSNLLQHGTALDNAESILPAITELGLSRAQTAELQDYIKQFLDEETKASKGCSLELLILDKFQHKWVTWRDEPLGKMQSALRTCIAFLRSGRLLVQPVIPLSTALSQEKRPRTATRPQSLPISGASRNIRTPPPWPPGRIQRPSAISGTPVQRPSVHNDDEGSSHVQNSEAIAEAIVALTPRTPGHTQTPTGALTEAELESFRKRCVKSVKGLSHEILEIHDVPRGKAALVIVENGPLSVTPFIESADDVDRPESPILGNKLRRTHQTISPGDWTTETSAADINGQHHRSPTTQGHPPLSPRHSPMDRPHTRPTFRLPPIDRSPVRPIPRLPPTRLSAPPINTPGSRTHSQTRPQQQRPMTYPPPATFPLPLPHPPLPPLPPQLPSSTTTAPTPGSGGHARRLLAVPPPLPLPLPLHPPLNLIPNLSLELNFNLTISLSLNLNLSLDTDLTPDRVPRAALPMQTVQPCPQQPNHHKQRQGRSRPGPVSPVPTTAVGGSGGILISRGRSGSKHGSGSGSGSGGSSSSTSGNKKTRRRRRKVVGGTAGVWGGGLVCPRLHRLGV